MLYNKNDSTVYIQEFKKRFTNFCEKCPMLLSFTTTPNGVQLINEISNDVYEISWDFSIPVKSFIHGIKSLLIDKNCYPIILKIESTEEEVTKEEQLSMAIEGKSLERIPIRRYKKNLTPYRIDKIIVFKDIFIIENQNTGALSRWKLNKSSIFFLKNLRTGKFTIEEAGAYFFEHATFLNDIERRKEEEEGE
jgi:hypothetical protein